MKVCTTFEVVALPVPEILAGVRKWLVI